MDFLTRLWHSWTGYRFYRAPATAPSSLRPTWAGRPYWLERVDDLPVLEDSAAMLSSYAGHRASIGNLVRPYAGSLAGFPLNDTRGNGGTSVTVHNPYLGTWRTVALPLGPAPMIEGDPGAGAAWDRHWLGIDGRRLVEAINLRPSIFGWFADEVAEWDPSTSSAEEVGFTTAPGLPQAPHLVTADEVLAGEVPHALWIVLEEVAPRWLWPARAAPDGKRVGAVPYGTLLRLRADYPLAGLGPQARAVATAWQRYGGMVGDRSGQRALAIGASPHPSFDQADLDGLARITAADLEVVAHPAGPAGSLSLVPVPQEQP